MTFSSNMGMSFCSLPSWCFASSTESVTFIRVSGLGQEHAGKYIQTSFHDGRSRYELLGKSCYVLHETGDSFLRMEIVLWHRFCDIFRYFVRCIYTIERMSIWGEHCTLKQYDSFVVRTKCCSGSMCSTI